MNKKEIEDFIEKDSNQENASNSKVDKKESVRLTDEQLKNALDWWTSEIEEQFKIDNRVKVKKGKIIKK